MKFKHLVLLFFVLAGCKKDQKPYVLATAVLSNFRLVNIDSSEYCKIPIDSNRTYFYKTYSTNRSNVFCGYNSTKRSLDFFSLTSKTMTGRTVLQPFNIDLTNGIRGVFYINRDSIFIYNNQSRIYLIDSLGNVKKSIFINAASSNPLFKHSFIHDWDIANNMYYDHYKGILYMPTMSIDKPRNSPEFYQAPILVSINVKADNFIKSVPIYYSPLYGLHYFGFADAPKFNFLDKDKIIYSFGVEPNIYVYDLKTEAIKVIGGALKQYPFISKNLEFKSAFDDDLKMDNLLHNVDYSKIIKDPYRNLYYRFQYNPVKDGPQKAATENDRRQFLTIFDSKLNIISTVELTGRRYILDGSFVTKDGLYVPAPSGYNSLSFKIFKVNVK